MRKVISTGNSVFIIILALLSPVTLMAEGEVKKAAPPTFEIINNYYIEDYSYTDDITRGTGVSISCKDPRGIVLFAENRHQEKFGRYEMLVRGGAGLKFLDNMIVQETVGFSADKNTFPNLLSETELVSTHIKNLAAASGYGLYSYNDVGVHVFSGGLTYYPTRRFYFMVKSFIVVSEFDSTDKTPTRNSFMVKGGLDIDGSNEVTFSYGNNPESFLAIDQIGRFYADTYVMGWNAHFTKNWYIIMSLLYQDRKKPVEASMRSMDLGFKYIW